MPTTQIVAGPDTMTPEWFDRVLRDAGALDGASVAGVETTAVGGGLMSRMCRATLTYDVDAPEAPASVIVKYPTDDEGSLGLARAMNMYELEVRFYRDVAPLLADASVPRCLLAEMDPESGLFTLVLEDLVGSRPGDVLTACSTDDCAAVLDALVSFQAPLWNSPSVAGMPWLADRRRTEGMFEAMQGGLTPFIARFGNGLDPAHVTLFETLLPRAGDWVRGWGAPTVVQHGDFRTDNLLFGEAPGAPPVTIIDFQVVRLGPPGVDAAYFVGSSLSTEARRAHERDLVNHYHERLVAAGIERFSAEDAWTSYRAGALYGVFLFVGLASQVESTERGDRVIVDQIRRYADMALDLDAAGAAGLA